MQYSIYSVPPWETQGYVHLLDGPGNLHLQLADSKNSNFSKKHASWMNDITYIRVRTCIPV